MSPLTTTRGAAAVHVLPVAGLEEVASETFWLDFARPEGAGCEPGQFFMLSPEEPSARVFLGRPLSIGDVRDGSWRFLVRVLGRGTAWMRRLPQGARLRIVGPLGRPFALRRARLHRMVAGGIGLAPFFYLARRLERAWPQTRIELVYGERSAAFHTRFDPDQSALFDHVVRVTDDGARGTRGTALDGLDTLDEDDGIAWYACGPSPMLAALADRLAGRGVTGAQFSLEERMACGFGVCQACVIENRAAPPRYSLLCTRGPVVDPLDVAW